MKPQSIERVLVLGDDLGVFLAVARSLGRRGVEVHVAWDEADAPGLSSRYIQAHHSLPPYASDGPGWAEHLAGLIAEQDFRLVIPCSDSDLVRLDRHAELLGRERLALANPQALAVFTDKNETRALAARTGVPAAEGGRLLAGESAQGLAARLGLPLVLKPQVSYRVGDRQAKRYAQILRTVEELEHALASAPCVDWLAEAFFEGEGVGVSVLAEAGRLLLAAQHRRLRTLSETGGSSVRITERTDPALLRDVQMLAEATKLSGVAMFEFRRNARDGRHVLIEVNPRFWGSLPLAVAAGADFPAELWDMTRGSPSPWSGAVRAGTVRRNMTGEFERIAAEVEASTSSIGKARALVSAAAFVAALPARSRFDSWAADDPAPYFAERSLLVGRLSAAVGKRLVRLKPSPGVIVPIRGRSPGSSMSRSVSPT